MLVILFVLPAFALQAVCTLTGVSLGPYTVAERAEGQRCSFSYREGGTESNATSLPPYLDCSVSAGGGGGGIYPSLFPTSLVT